MNNMFKLIESLIPSNALNKLNKGKALKAYKIFMKNMLNSKDDKDMMIYRSLFIMWIKDTWCPDYIYFA